ncbi:MAG TPA: hypothetical protein VH083_00705 [Myxococcales bacterium]|jgi:hypothetical protein|nr:hypothetical protein [Myxococcales bacterium]
MSRIVIHVDRLVLDGMGQLDRGRVGAGLTRELTRLLRARAPGALSGAARIDAGTVRLPAQASAHGTGGAIARAVHGALKGSPKGGSHV